MSVLDEYLAVRDEMTREHEEMRERVFAPGAVIPESEIEEFFARKQVMRDELTEIANRYETDPSDIIEDRRFWFPARRVSNGDYYSQGFGAAKYAKNAAEYEADKFRALGIPVEVEVREWSYNDRQWGKSTPGNINLHTTFTVMVGCSEDLAYMIMQRSVDLRDMIQGYLKRGVNPRVYLPFLPADIEERLGLDAFGNDKR